MGKWALLCFLWAAAATQLMGCRDHGQVLVFDGSFMEAISQKISGTKPVPVPALNPNLVTDLKITMAVGHEAVQKNQVEKVIKTWQIPAGLVNDLTAAMQLIAEDAPVTYKVFLLHFDVPKEVAEYGVLVGLGKLLNATHLHMGYSMASAHGTLLQQHEEVGYSCCKTEIFGICVDHHTCQKTEDRGDTPSELEAVTTTLQGCLKHQVQHLPSWFHNYSSCNTQESCESRQEVPGCQVSHLGSSRVSGDAVRRFLQHLWDDWKLQSALHSRSQDLQAWQKVYRKLEVDQSVGSLRSSGLPASNVKNFIKKFFNVSISLERFLNESVPGSTFITQTVKSVLVGHAIKLEFQVAFVIKGKADFDLWWIDVSNNQTFGLPALMGQRTLVREPSDIETSCQGEPKACNDINGTMDILLAVAVRAVARQEEIPLAPHRDGQVVLPSAWLGALQVDQSKGQDGFWGNFRKAVSNLAGALHDIISIFGSHTTKKLVKEETCLGFDHYDQNVSYLAVKCLQDAYTKDFVLKMLKKDLLWWFHGDEDKMAGALMAFQGDGTTWSQDRLNVKNSGTSNPRYINVYKNKDPKATCSNWVIVRSEVSFDLADDLLFWEVSTSKFGGLFSDDKMVVEHVPHKITPLDLEELRAFMHAMIIMHMADENGVNYTVPKLPQCQEQVIV